MSHSLNGPKQVEFEYNRAKTDRDVVLDQHGEMPCYDFGDIVRRRDKSWKVTKVLSQQSCSGVNTLLTLYVSLTDKF